MAIIGNIVLWYNDIEEGFQRSTYSKYGEIEEYWCNQDELELTVQYVLNEIREGKPCGIYLGPPQSIKK